MTASAIFALFVAAFVNAALPGPCVILTFGSTVRSGVRAGLVVTAGILAGDLLLVTAALAMTFGTLAVAPAAYPAMKWLGIACLLVLAGRSFRAAARPRKAGARPPAQEALAGLVIGLTSPYNLVFYVALFPQVLPAIGAHAGAAVAIGATAMGAIAIAQFGVVALAAGCHGLAGGRGGRWVDYATAAALLTIAGTAAAMPLATVEPSEVVTASSR